MNLLTVAAAFLFIGSVAGSEVDFVLDVKPVRMQDDIQEVNDIGHLAFKITYPAPPNEVFRKPTVQFEAKDLLSGEVILCESSDSGSRGQSKAVEVQYLVVIPLRGEEKGKLREKLVKELRAISGETGGALERAAQNDDYLRSLGIAQSRRGSFEVFAKFSDEKYSAVPVKVAIVRSDVDAIDVFIKKIKDGQDGKGK